MISIKRYIKKLKTAVFLLAAVAGVFLGWNTTAQAGSMYDSPYVTGYSHDGESFWTIRESLPYTGRGYQYIASHTAPEYWYEDESFFHTGIASTLRTPGVGEHYYSYDRWGNVPIGKWKVEWPSAHCIHPTNTAGEWQGLTVADRPCGNAYYSGWIAYCADCDAKITGAYVYASESAIRSLNYLNVDHRYYYICPTCNHLDNEGPLGAHSCKNISWNMYKVVYDRNGSWTEIPGHMDSSFHMYNNEEIYRGQPVTAVRRLSLNTYRRNGYTLRGWNTEPDGSGTFFADGAEILNLSLYDVNEDPERGTVTLYAQWERTESNLNIDPNGGAYDGNSGITTIHQGYGTSYMADPSKITPATGYMVSFETNGGGYIAPMESVRVFDSWRQSVPFHGRFVNNTYAFTGMDGITDTLKATYTSRPIILPTPVKPGMSFGGWFSDPACTDPIGFGGDEYTPPEDTTLYARWVELVLYSEDNYTANGGKGAVNLRWHQPDTVAKTYKLYRSEDNAAFRQIFDAQDTPESAQIAENYPFAQAPEYFVVPYSGFYELVAEGAQGGDYGAYTGGLGGQAKGRFYLRQGERITIAVGGKGVYEGGYNGGGTATAFGHGGGLTSFVSNEKGVLLVAGGGGGAAPAGHGGAGGANTSLRADGSVFGMNGQAGGGGGAVGGNAGEQIVHTHETACEMRHTHGPGCYETIPHEHSEEAGCEHLYHAYCGGLYRDEDGVYRMHYCPNCGVDEGLYGCTSHVGPGLCVEYWWWECDRTSDTVCVCGYEENELTGYRCGYEQGEVISSRPGYGGSSYANPAYVTASSFAAGVRSGNGRASIKALHVGFMGVLALDDVVAPDKAAPDAIDMDTVEITPINRVTVKVSFGTPESNGTPYYFKCESYQEGTETLLGVSNVTTNTLTSAIRGYYYIYNTDPSERGDYVTAANARNAGAPLESNSINLSINNPTSYLHIAAVDVAGNVGESICIPVHRDALDFPIMTDLVEVSDVIGDTDYHTVYAHPTASRTYYVRADGTGPVKLSFNSYMDGTASEAYQIDRQAFAAAFDGAGQTQRYTTILPKTIPVTASGALPGSEFVRTTGGDLILKDLLRTGASRANDATQNAFYQCFAIPHSHHGRTIVVTPMAGASRDEGEVSSVWEQDVLNAVTLIADGEAPVVTGMEVLETMTRINREEGVPVLTVTAHDDLSGLNKLTVTVVNLNSGYEQTFTPGASGSIVIDFGSNDVLFSGDLGIEVNAYDNVGNRYYRQYGTYEFELQAEVTRAADRSTNVCRRGDVALLHILTYGYADLVYVELPSELREGNEDVNLTFPYPSPSYVAEENVVFNIPLYCPDGTYTIMVYAHKGGGQLTATPALLTIAGSQLDDIRVRIR